MDDFDLQLEKAVARGQRERKLKTSRAFDKAMTEEDFRHLHNEYRSNCQNTLSNAFPVCPDISLVLSVRQS